LSDPVHFSSGDNRSQRPSQTQGKHCIADLKRRLRKCALEK
jgi:hypothetical protein